MTTLINNLLNDERGFVVSAELVLIATIAVLGMIVGLSEISFAVNNEMEDVSSAFGSLNQSYYVNGVHSEGKACTAGTEFTDNFDDCDSQFDISGSGVLGEY